MNMIQTINNTICKNYTLKDLTYFSNKNLFCSYGLCTFLSYSPITCVVYSIYCFSLLGEKFEVDTSISVYDL